MKASKMVAISAVSSAGAGFAVAMGNSIPMLDYSLFLLASMLVMVPILLGSYKGGILTAIASSLIGLMLVPNFVMVIPYVVFFAPYAVVLCVVEDKLSASKPRVFLGVVFKMVFFLACEILLWKFANFFVDFESWNLPIWVLIAMGLGVLFVFDFLMVRIRFQFKYQLERVFKNS